MAKTCDNKSVGTIIRKGEEILMINRHNYPEAFALPAGHLDGDSPDFASGKECKEEVGVQVMKQRMLHEGEINNLCKRLGGTHHRWYLFEATEWSGEPAAGSDAKEFFWASPKKLRGYAARTEYFFKKHNLVWSQVGELTLAVFGKPEDKNTDLEWLANPGLEPAWYYLLKIAKII